MSCPVSIFAFSNLFELMNEKFKIDRSPLLFIEKSKLLLQLKEKCENDPNLSRPPHPSVKLTLFFRLRPSLIYLHLAGKWVRISQ